MFRRWQDEVMTNTKESDSAPLSSAVLADMASNDAMIKHGINDNGQTSVGSNQRTCLTIGCGESRSKNMLSVA